MKGSEMVRTWDGRLVRAAYYLSVSDKQNVKLFYTAAF